MRHEFEELDEVEEAVEDVVLVLRVVDPLVVAEEENEDAVLEATVVEAAALALDVEAVVLVLSEVVESEVVVAAAVVVLASVIVSVGELSSLLLSSFPDSSDLPTAHASAHMWASC